MPKEYPGRKGKWEMADLQKEKFGSEQRNGKRHRVHMCWGLDGEKKKGKKLINTKQRKKLKERDSTAHSGRSPYSVHNKKRRSQKQTASKYKYWG